MNARLVVAVAVILLFKNVETPGAFLRHQVGGRAFEAAGWKVVSLDIVSKFEPTILYPELGLHDVSGALRHGLGQPQLHGIQLRVSPPRSWPVRPRTGGAA